MNAPRWVIKAEQVAMVLNRCGRKHYPIGKTPSNAQATLYERHVKPAMGK
jgi:hypothetical protein